MEIKYNVTGLERKELVNAISGIVGWEAVYKKAPTFAYVVNNYTIDKHGTLICDERTDQGDVHRLLSELTAQGFIFEDITNDDVSVEAVTATIPDRLSIEMPLEGFTEKALDNLEKLVASKAMLIRKSLSTDSLEIVRKDDRLCFPWFTFDSSADTVGAYSQFVTALCEMAKTQKRVIATEKPADSEKFAFRCFLLRLGFIGSEYAAARKILLANLPGSGAFKRGARKQPEIDAIADSVATTGFSGMNSLAEMMADAELIYQVNNSFEEGAANE